MEEENIKHAFEMVKQDISYLSQEISILRQNLLEISRKLEKMDNFLKTDISTQRQQNQAVSTDISTMDYGFKAVKGNNLPISIGNQGVSTDRQTDRQTDSNPPIADGKTGFLPKKQEKTEILDIDQAADILDSLDSIKKEIRLKFKRLTGQEMQIFSLIYQLSK